MLMTLLSPIPEQIMMFIPEERRFLSPREYLYSVSMGALSVSGR